MSEPGHEQTAEEKRPSVAALVRRRVAHSHERFWVPADFADLPRRRVLRALDRLEQRGELERVRRGLYWRGHRPDGSSSQPAPEQLVEQIVGLPGVGPSGKRAAWMLGMLEREPAEVIVAVPARAPREIEGIGVRSRAGRTGRIRRRLESEEVALLEFLEDPSLHELAGRGEMREALAALRIEQLVGAAAHEPAIVRQGLINALRAVGCDERADRVPPCFGKLAAERAWRA